MVGAEDAGSTVIGMFIQTVNFGCNKESGAIPYQDVVENQSG